MAVVERPCGHVAVGACGCCGPANGCAPKVHAVRLPGCRSTTAATYAYGGKPAAFCYPRLASRRLLPRWRQSLGGSGRAAAPTRAHATRHLSAKLDCCLDQLAL